jgi:hypothetical protein
MQPFARVFILRDFGVSPWSTEFLEKSIVMQPVKEFHAFYMKTEDSLTVFRKLSK